jgi:metal-dependent HD superfamily phosphatase/phosphodiesterase
MEIQSYLRMGNVMAVSRLNYNDHGPVHAKIISGSALEIFNLLSSKVEPTSITNGVCDYVGAKLIVLLGAYLHDLGNAVHRVNHESNAIILAAPILDRLLGRIYPEDHELVFRLKSEVLHSIFASHEEIQCLSVEAGIVTVADGTDMAGGRSREPYLGGKNDIHSISALAINKVDIEPGGKKPVSIKVYMDNPAGVYQVEEIMGKKLETCGIIDHIEVIAIMDDREIKTL